MRSAPDAHAHDAFRPLVCLDATLVAGCDRPGHLPVLRRIVDLVDLHRGACGVAEGLDGGVDGGVPGDVRETFSHQPSLAPPVVNTELATGRGGVVESQATQAESGDGGMIAAADRHRVDMMQAAILSHEDGAGADAVPNDRHPARREPLIGIPVDHLRVRIEYAQWVRYPHVTQLIAGRTRPAELRVDGRNPSNSVRECIPHLGHGPVGGSVGQWPVGHGRVGHGRVGHGRVGAPEAADGTRLDGSRELARDDRPVASRPTGALGRPEAFDGHDRQWLVNALREVHRLVNESRIVLTHADVDPNAVRSRCGVQEHHVVPGLGRAVQLYSSSKGS